MIKNEDEKNKFDELIINRIGEICDKKNITYYKLAKNSGIRHSTLTAYLNRVNPGTTTTTLKKIVAGLGISIEEFFNHKYFK